VLADYRSYVDCQDAVDELYRTPREWMTKTMHNIANMGYFFRMGNACIPVVDSC